MIKQKMTFIVYLLIILTVTYFNYKQGLSLVYTDSAQVTRAPEDISKALDYDDTNPEPYATESRLELEAEDYSKAVDTLRQAITLRENDHLLWLRLGFAYNKLGDFENARAAYAKSLQLAPDYAQTNRFMGRLLLKTGEIDRAFEFLRKAAALDHEMYPEVLHLARKQFPADGAAIERLIAPQTAEDRQILALYLIKHSLITETAKNFMLAPATSDAVKNIFVKSLIERNNYPLAREIWLTLPNNLALAGNAQKEMLIDGGFEHTGSLDDTGVGWRVNQKLNDDSVSIEANRDQNGGNAMRFNLNGDAPVDEDLVSQTFAVEPDKLYLLEFSLLSSSVTSYNDVAVQVRDHETQQILGQSMPFKDTATKWERFSFVFRASSQAATVALRRSPCTVNPCPVFADFRLDSFTVRQK